MPTASFLQQVAPHYAATQPQYTPKPTNPTNYYDFQQNAGIPSNRNTGINYNAPVARSDSGGGSLREQMEKGLIPWDDNKLNSGGGGAPAPSTYFDQGTGQTFGSYDDFLREIDSSYQGSYDYLNQAENAVKADYPNAMAEAEAQFKTNQSTLGNQKQQAFSNLDQQKSKATNTYENALADARRIYQEQALGAVQRFGGSSSAGQAASEIQAREQARQFGNTNRQYTDLVNQVETQRNQVDSEYQTGLLQLEQQKQSAIANATRDFQNKLLQIANNRAQIGQAKAEARLNALQQLRSEVFAIEQQNKQFAQELEGQRQSALLQLGNFGQSTQQVLSNVQNAVGGYRPTASLNSSTAATGGLRGQPTQQLTGSIKRPEDQYVGAIQKSPYDPYNLQSQYGLQR